MKLGKAEFFVSKSVLDVVYAREPGGRLLAGDAWTEDVLEKLEARLTELASGLGLEVEFV